MALADSIVCIMRVKPFPSSRDRGLPARILALVAALLISMPFLAATDEEKVESLKVSNVNSLDPKYDPSLPTLFIAGDSTAAKGTGEAYRGWGFLIGDYFDPSEVNVVNRARGGRSSRTFVTEGLWSELAAEVKRGDFVLIQFGHNDGGAINREPPGSDRPLRARGSLPGLGDGWEAISNAVTGKPEIVRTYGWYMRKMIADTIEKGATPILLSLTVRNIWLEGRVERGSGLYGRWSYELSQEMGVPFIDISNIVADQMDVFGQEAVDPMYPRDHTHTSERGADLHAATIVGGLKGLSEFSINEFLSPKGKGVDAQFSDPIIGGRFPEPILFRLTDEKENGLTGSVALSPDDVYSEKRGYGYDNGMSPNRVGDPYYFSVLAYDGNYRVTVSFGSETESSSNTVKAESRRLALENVNTSTGAFETRSFTVNVRNDQLAPPERFAPGSNAVVLNERELGALHWDNKLTLEFNGSAPKVRSIEIQSVTCPTIYLVGDSTVTDQTREPSASWGQMLPRFLDEGVAVANHAESGETMKSFISGLRLAKVLESMKEGDYLFMQFTHNDQKKQWPQTYVEADTTYKAYLKVLIAETRLRGATPVFVTSMQRRRFNESGRIVSTLGDYPKAMRELAKEENVALIDLESMSVELYESLGTAKAPFAFSNGGKDATHHNNYGAYQLAKCVVQGIREAKLDLAKYILDDFSDYDPTNPDDVDTFRISASPNSNDVSPRGG
jgi:lysophospholipase L1-like esterase